MDSFTLLAHFYDYVTVVYRPSTIGAKLCLLSLMYLVHTGNEKPGLKLLTGAFAAQFLISAYLATGRGGLVLIPLIVGIMMGGIFVNLLREEVRWRILPPEENPVARYLAILGYTVAILFPFLAKRFGIHSFVYAPLGTLPHGGVMAAMILLGTTAAAGTRLMPAMGVTALAAIILLTLEGVAGRYGASITLVGGLVYMGWMVKYGLSANTAKDDDGRKLEDDPLIEAMKRTVVETSNKATEKIKQTGSGNKGKKWDL